MMSKKGVSYPEFMVLLVLIAIPFIILAVHNQLDSYNRVIGDYEVAVLSADTERSMLLDVIDDNAVPAFNHALQILSERGGFEKEACGGWNQGCAIINSKKDPKDLCLPEISKCLNKFFNQEMHSLNRKSGFDYFILAYIPFELYVNNSEVKGIALKNIERSLPSETTNIIGNYNFKPSFTINVENELEIYPKEIFPVLKNIVNSCLDKENPKSCLEGWIPKTSKKVEWKTWVDEKDEDIVYLKANLKEFERSVCYGLYLPKSRDSSLKT